VDRYDDTRFRQMAALVQERVATLADVPAMVDFLFLDSPEMDEVAWAAIVADAGAAGILDAAITAYVTVGWTAAELHAVTLALSEAVGRKLGKAQAPIRVAVTGRRVGPPLFESLEVLGRAETLARLQAARTRLDSAGTGRG
jgi:glutamyl-tRNA synthetase